MISFGTPRYRKTKSFLGGLLRFTLLDGMITEADIRFPEQYRNRFGTA